MERLVRTLKMEFAAVLLWSTALVGLFETETWQTGGLADNAEAGYYMNTAGIIMMCVMVPTALKLFSFRFVRNVFSATEAGDLPRRYRRWAEVRLSMLAVAGWTNVASYYLTMNAGGAFCALVTLLAFCFCWPSAGKVRHEAGMRPVPEVEMTKKQEQA